MRSRGVLHLGPGNNHLRGRDVEGVGVNCGCINYYSSYLVIVEISAIIMRECIDSNLI